MLALRKNESLPSQAGWADPWSPDDANNVMFFAFAASKMACWFATSVGDMHVSPSPKLIEMTSPTLLSTAYLSALLMSASLFDFATTSVMFAAGATACAH